MEEGTKSKDHLISAAAFVEGGTQDACDDACSICLEAFSDNDPPTVTGCKHEFHLQCILEWCQRSSQCPMCWQSISLKDPSSQELLDAIEQERSIANNPSMNTTIFHHPTFGDFELQHLPVGATEADLEERIIQHLAAAAAMGRARHIARREAHRNRTSAQARPRYLGFSAQPTVPSPTRPVLTDDVEPTTPTIGGPPLAVVHEEPLRGTAPSSSSSSSVHASEPPASPMLPNILPARPHDSPSTNRSVIRPSPINQDRAGPSEQNSFSDFKTRVNAISMRYKDSITKTTKNWKERLFSRNNSPTDHGSKDNGEGSEGITTLSRMMDHLQHDLSPVSNSVDSPNSSTYDSASRNEVGGPHTPPPQECQRSSQCPMCWQSISLKDPSSQELLDAIEQERSIANNPSMNTTIFHHPTFGDFELQHLPVGATEADLEERIIQHLAAAAAMGRARHIARREAHRNRTSAQARPRYLGFSAQPTVPSPTRPVLTDDVEPTTPTIGGPPLAVVHEEPLRGTAPSSSSSSSVHASEPPASPMLPNILPARPHDSPSTNRLVIRPSPINQDRAGPSEQNSFSDFKTRVNAISMRYKDSITKTTKNWKERLFSRNNSPTDHRSKDNGEGSEGITTLSRMMDHLQHDLSPVSNSVESPNSSTNNSASRNEVAGPHAPPPQE